MRGLKAGVLAALLLSTASPAQAYHWRHRWSGPPSWLGVHQREPGTVAAGDAPGNMALDPVTHTLYINDENSGMLTLVDASRCNARRRAGCDATPATVDVGTVPVGIGLDLRTRTLYIADLEDDTVSLFDATRCNVVTPAACVPVARVPLSGDPLVLAIDPVTDTVYVGNGMTASLGVLDGRTCNRLTPLACPAAMTTAVVGRAPIAPSIDAASRTLYVGNAADGTVSVLDMRQCNGQVTTGCAQTPPALTSGPIPVLTTVDPATHTLYADNSGDGTLSVFDAATCNAAVTSGCGQTPVTTIVGSAPDGGMVVDGPTHSLFVGAGQSDVISVVDTAVCHAGGDCARRWPTIQVGSQPAQLLHDTSTATLYVSNYQDDALLVLDATACTSIRRSGCRDQPPGVAAPVAYDIGISEQEHTVYLAAAVARQLAMIDTSRCRERRPDRCTPVAVDVPNVSEPVRLAVDDATHTLYVSDREQRHVAVIDLRRCNADRHDGCAPVATAVATGEEPVGLAVNPLTHAVYVADVVADTLTAFDGAHCNAVDRSRCGRPPLVGTIGRAPVYVSQLGDDFSGHTVSVVDGRNCCAAKATVDVGRFPQGIVADSATHTVYVANQAFNDEPGSLSMIDTRRCHGRDTSDCGQTTTRVPAGRGSAGVALNPFTHAVYTADSGHATTTFIDGATCNALRQLSCGRDPHQVAIGFEAFRLALDRAHDTLYVPSTLDSLVTVIDTDR
jgi:DNA-binding beta-propeller fold protein YncE